jgi:hypothetical protein
MFRENPQSKNCKALGPEEIKYPLGIIVSRLYMKDVGHLAGSQQVLYPSDIPYLAGQ